MTDKDRFIAEAVALLAEVAKDCENDPGPYTEGRACRFDSGPYCSRHGLGDHADEAAALLTKWSGIIGVTP